MLLFAGPSRACVRASIAQTWRTTPDLARASVPATLCVCTICPFGRILQALHRAVPVCVSPVPCALVVRHAYCAAQQQQQPPRLHFFPDWQSLAICLSSKEEEKRTELPLEVDVARSCHHSPRRSHCTTLLTGKARKRWQPCSGALRVCQSSLAGGVASLAVVAAVLGISRGKHGSIRLGDNCHHPHDASRRPMLEKVRAMLPLQDQSKEPGKAHPLPKLSSIEDPLRRKHGSTSCVVSSSLAVVWILL